jgi:hypothetical protein
VGFEPAIPASARPQTYALDSAATGLCVSIINLPIYPFHTQLNPQDFSISHYLPPNIHFLPNLHRSRKLTLKSFKESVKVFGPFPLKRLFITQSTCSESTTRLYILCWPPYAPRAPSWHSFLQSLKASSSSYTAPLCQCGSSLTLYTVSLWRHYYTDHLA